MLELSSLRSEQLYPGGYFFSTKALQPKLEKINPISGAKRIFAMRALVELIKVNAENYVYRSRHVFYLMDSHRRCIKFISEKYRGLAGCLS